MIGVVRLTASSRVCFVGWVQRTLGTSAVLGIIVIVGIAIAVAVVAVTTSKRMRACPPGGASIEVHDVSAMRKYLEQHSLRTC
jgi:hypothetical protein